MSVIFVLVPVALTLVVAAIAAFVLAARRGQFDDLATPALRALHDEVEGTPTGGEERTSGEDREPDPR